MDVRTVLQRGAHTNAHRTAVVAGDRRLSYAEAWERGLRLANGLLGQGLDPQDKVAVLENNGLPAVDLYLGAAAANLCRVPLYVRNGPQSHIEMLNNVQARALVVDAEHVHEVAGIQEHVPTLEHVIVRDEGYEDWLARQSAAELQITIAPDDLFIIRHTGGTTGRARGVASTHEMWWRGARDWFYLFPPPVAGDPIMHVGPISHASGYLFLPIWAAGGVEVMVSGLTPEQVAATIESERIAYVFLPPTLLAQVCRTPGVTERDHSALKVLLVGASPISEETIARARTTFGDDCLWQLYGGTEACPTAGMGPGEWFADVPGSEPLRAAGRVFPWGELELRDEEGAVVAPGEVGEVWVRSDTSAREFHNAPDETAARIKDGWVAVGDLGRIDDNGYLYLVDRKNDMIVSGGYNIYPGELENVIASVPGVLDVAVFGIPDEKWGETPMAVCVVEEASEVTPEQVVALVAERLGSYRKPGRVELRTTPLPRSAVGKVLRRELRDPYWAGRDRRIAGA